MGAFEPLTDFVVAPTQTARLARTLSLMRLSGPMNRPVVRVIFYGQSITIYPWWQEVSERLKAAYPYVRFEIQNLAISGFMADRLAQACEYDVIPAQPDLIILHAYGWEDGFKDLLGKLRSRTTADILVQRDHPLSEAELVEETDPARLEGTNPETWEYKNYVWLPRQVELNGCCLADVRGYWKRYCQVHNLSVRQLLGDPTHPNEEGNHVMAAAVLAYLLPGLPFVQVRPWKGGRAVEWTHVRDPAGPTRKLALSFTGTRVDAVTDRVQPGSVSVRLDGRAPSEIPELRGFRRGTTVPGLPWPAVTVIGSRAPLLTETWTLSITAILESNNRIEFHVDGSKTGFDGKGTSLTTFVSNSGRVVIPPGTWLLGYGLILQGIPLPTDYQIQWNCEWVGVDALECSAPEAPGGYPVTTLAAGLTDGKHRLELEGLALAGVRALRIYRPTGTAEIQLLGSLSALNAPRLRMETSQGRLRFQMEGGEGFSALLETSTDLLQWRELGRLTTEGPSWTPDSTDSQRLFRLRVE